jgi:hypothetical protein
VEDLIERRRAHAGLLGQLADAAHGALRRVVRRRGELVDEDPARLVVYVDQIRERAADVDAETLHRSPFTA